MLHRPHSHHLVSEILNFLEGGLTEEQVGKQEVKLIQEQPEKIVQSHLNHEKIMSLYLLQLVRCL